jgi:hypothetical protein
MPTSSMIMAVFGDHSLRTLAPIPVIRERFKEIPRIASAAEQGFQL